MENLAPIHINLTDKEMVPEVNPRGYMAMVYENKLIALIIVLIVILLCVLAYTFWKRDGGKQAERQSPYRRGGVAAAQPQQQHSKPSREELEREREELDSEDESEDVAPKQESAEPESKPAEESTQDTAENTERDAEPHDDVAPADSSAPPAGGKATCEYGNCKNKAPSGRKLCWRHEKKAS